jgi:hypothetical protein
LGRRAFRQGGGVPKGAALPYLRDQLCRNVTANGVHNCIHQAEVLLNLCKVLWASFNNPALRHLSDMRMFRQSSPTAHVYWLLVIAVLGLAYIPFQLQRMNFAKQRPKLVPEVVVLLFLVFAGLATIAKHPQ